MDWIQLLEDNHVPYVTRGPNTRKGEVSVKCPWCAEDDPSEHLGIALEREVWGCHRNAEHRGKSPLKLIQALLGCSHTQAKLVIAQYGASDPEALIGFETPEQAPVKPPEALKLPTEFKGIPAAGRFWDYLKNRGFDVPQLVAETYDLKCCTSGRWKDRIIIPVYQNNTLVAWTARALTNPVLAPRYLSTSEVIKTVVFNSDNLKGGSLLFITEGPFDAMKVDYCGYKRHASATAVFGTSITMDQISILRGIMPRYEKVILLLDADATETTFNMTDWLPGAIIGSLPDGAKDPGQLSKAQVNTLISQFL